MTPLAVQPEPQRAEQHDERADDQGQRREDLPRLSELEDRLLDHALAWSWP